MSNLLSALVLALCALFAISLGTSVFVEVVNTDFVGEAVASECASAASLANHQVSQKRAAETDARWNRVIAAAEALKATHTR